MYFNANIVLIDTILYDALETSAKVTCQFTLIRANVIPSNWKISLLLAKL